ncbi:MAG: glycosyltransferase family 2 protein [Cyanobacteriota bacterium]|nr:glycosyltransferase family 2 protein [Cyanobacteriota bacterium]
MKFTIAIATYNRLAFLKRAIDTALSQTVQCEVVVVDDGSNDGTQEYVEDLSQTLAASGDGRLIYHRNSHNLGHSGSVNAGVERATGEWVKLLDDDDYLAPNCLEKMSEAIALRPQAVLCSCQAVQVDEEESELTRTRAVGPGRVFYIPQEDIHYGMLLEQVPFGTPVQVAFRRDAFLKTGGWDSSLDANFDDIDSWIKISRFGDAIFINEYLAYRTVWCGSFNQKFSLENRLKAHILIKHRIYNLVNSKHRSEIPNIKQIESYLKLHWSLVALKKAQVRSTVSLAFPAMFLPGSWNLLFSLNHRFADKSSSSKTKLGSVSNEKENLKAYLKLKLLEQSLKEKQWGRATKFLLPIVFSPAAWKLILNLVILKKRRSNLSPVRKFVLIDS